MKEYSLICDFCQQSFPVNKIQWRNRRTKRKIHGIKHYCSNDCKLKSRGCESPKIIPCFLCGKKTKTSNKDIRVSKNNFCSHSCRTIYYNTHKTTGTRRSKLEKWLESELPLLFSSLEFHFNRKDAINSELDIFIPSLSLAFELNGIFHYEPIYGKNKLSQIQNNDNRKFQACLEKGIELCIIDTSKLGYFKPANAKPYLDIIIKIIRQKLASLPELESGT
jgi:hypothetical protein